MPWWFRGCFENRILETKRRCQDAAFNFLETILKTILIFESNALRRELCLETRAILEEEKKLGQGAMLDDGIDAWFEIEFLERKRSCQCSGFQLFQALLSGSMVRAKWREVRRWFHRAAMLGDESDRTIWEQRLESKAILDAGGWRLSLTLKAKRHSLILEVVLDSGSGCFMVRNSLRCYKQS